MMFLQKSSVQVQKLGLKPRPPPAPQSTMRPNSIGIGFCILLCSRKKSFRNQFIICQPPILNSESINIFSQNFIFVFGGSKWVFGGNNSCLYRHCFCFFDWSQSKILPHRKTKQHRICSSKKKNVNSEIKIDGWHLVNRLLHYIKDSKKTILEKKEMQNLKKI